jgi:diacylglycerol kinase (ATP)
VGHGGWFFVEKSGSGRGTEVLAMKLPAIVLSLARGSHKEPREPRSLMTQPPRDALLILNPRAGRARNLLSGGLDRLRTILAAQGIETDLARTDAPEGAEEAARGAMQQKRDLVIACGGDGTLNAVVNGLAGSQIPLALLPAGTANILAKELHLPKDIERAAQSLGDGVPRRIALGMVTHRDGSSRGRYFLSVGGAGPDGAIVQAVNNHLKRHTGMLAFWMEGARQLALYKFPRFRVTTEDAVLEATMIVVGRTKHYGGPLRITTEADLFGDDFQIMVCATRSRAAYLSFVPLAVAGQVRRAPGITFLRSKAFQCEPLDRPPALAQVDGEPAGPLPAEFRTVPDALTLLVPQLGA